MRGGRVHGGRSRGSIRAARSVSINISGLVVRRRDLAAER
jgi:hypothetical protein